ncbi:MAG: hypothetical protein IKB05_03295 [Alphaproteobacteria bacterium]|nr:hypothetical protein [Alphaproteobacteria bacterium]
MKVKNIMFAGFASAILSGVCGAASAADYNLVTQGYVTEKLADKADVGASYTKTEADNLLGGKVSTQTYAQYLEAQEATDKKQTEDIASNTAAINTLSGGEGGEGVATLMQDISALKTAVNDENGAVAQKIATAIATEELRADGKYQEKGDYALKSELPTDYVTSEGLAAEGFLKAETAATTYQPKGDYQPAGSYVTTQALTEAGYATTSEMNTALQGKQDTITDLDTIRSGAALGATAMQSIGNGTVTKAMLAEGVQASLDAAGTAVQPSALNDYVTTENLNAAGYQTEEQVEAEIAGATIQQSQVSGLDTALAGKLDDTMTAAGTYLVKRAENGDISYVSVEIVGETEAE